MGHRHLYGLAELQSAGLSPFELVGACDPNLDNAHSLADQAEERLGTRPQPVKNLAELASVAPVQAVDITTLPAHHHTVAIEAMERGWHALCEKHMGLTARACKQMIAKAQETGCVLSVGRKLPPRPGKPPRQGPTRCRHHWAPAPDAANCHRRRRRHAHFSVAAPEKRQRRPPRRGRSLCRHHGVLPRGGRHGLCANAPARADPQKPP